MLRYPCILGDPQTNKGGQNKKSKPPLGVTMMPLGAPSISKYGSLVRLDAQIVALHAHCAKCAHLNNQKIWFLKDRPVPHPYLLGRQKAGGNATSPLHSRGSPNKGGQNQNWLPHPCLVGDQKEGGKATSALHSRGSPTKGDKIRIGYLTHRGGDRK